MKASWQKFRSFINLVDIKENVKPAMDDALEMENDGGTRLAKVALCMASYAACH